MNEASPLQTDDGSYTLRHPTLGELYHARQGAASEAQVKFVQATQLAERLRKGPVRLLDIGTGLGVNCRAALKAAEGGDLQIDTLELEPEALQRGLQLDPQDPLLLSLSSTGRYPGVTLHLGDLRQTLPRLDGHYDVIFHDPFSPLKNTEAWTVEVFGLLFQKLAPKGILATYSESSVVRSAMREAGFQVGESKAVPPHRGGTVGVRPGQSLDVPLHPETFHTEPYRDPDLCWDGKRIRSERERVVRSSRS